MTEDRLSDIRFRLEEYLWAQAIGGESPGVRGVKRAFNHHVIRDMEWLLDNGNFSQELSDG